MSGFSGSGSFSTRLQLAAAFVLGLAIVLLPVAARNYAVGGGFYLTTSQFGPNFFIGNNPNADGTYMSLRFGRGAPEYERQDATELAEHATGRTLTPSEVSSYWTDRALDFITAHPARWVSLVGRKAMLLVNATEMLDTESQESYAEWSWPLRLTGVVQPLRCARPTGGAGNVSGLARAKAPGDFVCADRRLRRQRADVLRLRTLSSSSRSAVHVVRSSCTLSDSGARDARAATARRGAAA